METIYVLINVHDRDINEIVREIEKLENVKEVSVVTGAYDILVRIEGEYITNILTTVVKGIRRIDGVKSTETLVSVKM